jgi:transposase-like protein
MSRSTISTFQLFQMFPDEETARTYLESRLWPKGVTCPTCAGQDRITPRKAGFHRCNKCQLDFTIRTGTIFERSHIPLHKWLYAMYLLVTARKGISSMQIAKEIGVQQKSAWFMLHRLREACGGELAKLHGVYHHASPKHLHRYVDEFTFRLNDGDVKRHTMQRLDSFIQAMDGKRLTYARLIQ